MGPDSVTFLNEPGTIATSGGWNDPGRAKLWLYNLHYFDDLNGDRSPERDTWQRSLVDRWIAENPHGAGVGWEPYPTSLRIANWIKWALSGSQLAVQWTQSLAIQVRWLERRLEWHLLGNHLLANAKALILAGLYFAGPEAERWLDLGTRILRRQLKEQILDDGGQFERSPMYHAIILEDLLDLWNAARAYGVEQTLGFVELAQRVGPMQSWLVAMTHPDSGIAFFNDAAFGIAMTTEQLSAYASRLGLPGPERASGAITFLKDTGYVRVERDGVCAIIDIAPIGPDHLPGHAHADTLSFELSAGSERVVVNGGTSCYGDSTQRSFERGTAAHSTVEIDGQDSSEVWGGFRVARRANMIGIKTSTGDDGVSVSGGHDGYRRLRGRPTHARTWRFASDRLAVTDTISGSFRTAVARFHLGRGVDVDLDAGERSGILRTPKGAVIRFRASEAAALIQSEWHPEFGVTIPINCLTVPFRGQETVETEFAW